jgi:hypothetical protein
MGDDDRDISHLDPSRLLPYERVMEADDPNVEKVPRHYRNLDNREFFNGSAPTRD